jgi:hypothetical protein
MLFPPEIVISLRYPWVRRVVLATQGRQLRFRTFVPFSNIGGIHQTVA